MTGHTRTVLLAVLVAVAALPATGTAAAATAQTGDCGFPYQTTDDVGGEVSLDERPQRIVALQPSDAQMLWAIGAQDRVVGMPLTPFTGYLDNRSGRTDITNDDGTTDVEAVVGTNPDLVVAANTTSRETVERLRALNVTVYHFDTVNSLEEIGSDLETVGRLTGDCGAAAEALSSYQSRLDAVRERVADRDSPRVLYYFYGFTAGNGTHIHDAIEAAGGDNVAANAGIQGYQQLNPEIVAARDPEFIVYPQGATVPDRAPFNGTTAVQQGNTLEVNANYISQPGPRVATVVETMADAFYANRTTQTPAETTASGQTATPAASTDTPAPTATATPTVTETAGVGTAPDETTAGSGPGFGAAGALAALVLATLVARRKGV